MASHAYPCAACFSDGTTRCAGCGVTYCGRACQRGDWSAHRNFCRAAGANDVSAVNALAISGVALWDPAALAQSHLALLGTVNLVIHDGGGVFSGATRVAPPGEPPLWYVYLSMRGRTPVEYLKAMSESGATPRGDCQTFLRLLGIPPTRKIPGALVLPFGTTQVSLIPPGMKHVGGNSAKMRKVLNDPLFGCQRGLWVAHPAADILWGVWGDRLRTGTVDAVLGYVWEGVVARLEEMMRSPSELAVTLGHLGNLYLGMGAKPALLTSAELVLDDEPVPAAFAPARGGAGGGAR